MKARGKHLPSARFLIGGSTQFRHCTSWMMPKPKLTSDSRLEPLLQWMYKSTLLALFLYAIKKLSETNTGLKKNMCSATKALLGAAKKTAGGICAEINWKLETAPIFSKQVA